MKGISTPIAMIIAELLDSFTLVSGIYLLTEKDIYINQIGGVDSATGRVVNTITVNGEGKVYATPDMLIFSVDITETKDTSKEALKAVNEK
jgi:hypothetical protein